MIINKIQSYETAEDPGGNVIFFCSPVSPKLAALTLVPRPIWDFQQNDSFLKVDDQTSTTFWSLRREAEYCVSVKVEDKASETISRVSSKQCVVLPEQGNQFIATFLI